MSFRWPDFTTLPLRRARRLAISFAETERAVSEVSVVLPSGVVRSNSRWASLRRSSSLHSDTNFSTSMLAVVPWAVWCCFESSKQCGRKPDDERDQSKHPQNWQTESYYYLRQILSFKSQIVFSSQITSWITRWKNGKARFRCS